MKYSYSEGCGLGNGNSFLTCGLDFGGFWCIRLWLTGFEAKGHDHAKAVD